MPTIRTTATRAAALACLLLAGISAPALADNPPHAKMPVTGTPGMAPAQAMDMMTDGEVRKVDKSTKKITLKHGEIRNLDMPPMTMVFRVSDPAMLDQVQPGDKVRFAAEEIKGKVTVTAIEPAK